jgi:hypothetical protein
MLSAWVDIAFSVVIQDMAGSHLEIQCSKSRSRHVSVHAVFQSPRFDIPLRDKTISIFYRATIFPPAEPSHIYIHDPNDLYISILVLCSLTADIEAFNKALKSFPDTNSHPDQKILRS